MIKINLLKDTTNVGPTPTSETFAAFDGGAEVATEASPKDMAVKLLLVVLPVGLAIVALSVMKEEKLTAIAQLKAKVSELEKKKVSLGPQIDAVKNFQKEKERLQVQIETIKTLSRERLRNVKALESIQTIIPEKAWLQELKILEGQVRFVGQAVDDQTIAQFMQGLEENVFFKNIRLVKSSEVTRPDGVVKLFEIESNLEGM